MTTFTFLAKKVWRSWAILAKLGSFVNEWLLMPFYQFDCQYDVHLIKYSWMMTECHKTEVTPKIANGWIKLFFSFVDSFVIMNCWSYKNLGPWQCLDRPVINYSWKADTLSFWRQTSSNQTEFWYGYVFWGGEFISEVYFWIWQSAH